MPLPRYEKMPEEKKNQILEAAAQEFAAHGYEKAVMNRILERAGISKGAAYYYFEDKADLIATVVRHYWMEFMGGPGAVIENYSAEDFWEKLGELYLHPFDLIEVQPWLLGFSRAVWELPEKIRNSGPLGEIFTDAIEWVRQFIRRGHELGVIRDDLPEDLLINVIMALDHVHDEWLSEHWEAMGKTEFEAFTRTYVGFMKRALERSEAPEKNMETGSLTS